LGGSPLYQLQNETTKQKINGAYNKKKKKETNDGVSTLGGVQNLALHSYEILAPGFFL
jgi:hypothetical protein